MYRGNVSAFIDELNKYLNETRMGSIYGPYKHSTSKGNYVSMVIQYYTIYNRVFQFTVTDSDDLEDQILNWIKKINNVQG